MWKLTVRWGGNTEEAHEWKVSKYQEAVEECGHAAMALRLAAKVSMGRSLCRALTVPYVASLKPLKKAQGGFGLRGVTHGLLLLGCKEGLDQLLLGHRGKGVMLKVPKPPDEEHWVTHFPLEKEQANDCIVLSGHYFFTCKFVNSPNTINCGFNYFFYSADTWTCIHIICLVFQKIWLQFCHTWRISHTNPRRFHSQPNALPKQMCNSLKILLKLVDRSVLNVLILLNYSTLGQILQQKMHSCT